MQQIRKSLSKSNNPPIDALISAGVVPILVTFLDCDDK